MGSNNRYNQSIRREICRLLGNALELHYAGQAPAAQQYLTEAAGLLFKQPFGRTVAWDRQRELYTAAKQEMEGPCLCLYCSLSSEQQRVARELAAEKAGHLDAMYSNDVTNFTGAYAEVVFGVKLGLPINQEPGFDGGKDFTAICRGPHSRTITIDVKGTTYADFRSGRPQCAFPPQHHWNQSPNHVYVLLHIVDGRHAFFRGFAFGNDRAVSQPCRIDGQKQSWNGPLPSRTLAELERVLAGTSDVNEPAMQSPTPLEAPKPPKVPMDLIYALCKVKNVRSVGKPEEHVMSRFKANSAVRHPDYGVGRVIGDPVPFRDGYGWDVEICVGFGAQIRRFASKIAPLEMMEDSVTG